MDRPSEVVPSSMAQSSAKSEPDNRVLDPMDRISEVLFGLIMALTFTLTLGVATADNIKIRTMLIGALGCNLAWGIIDAGVFLLAQLNERGRNVLKWREVREAADIGTAQRIIADYLPPLLASALQVEQLELMRLRLHQTPEPARPHLTKRDWRGASAICLLSFASTFPIIIPFIFISDARLALRVSNGVAMAMLFLGGYAFGRYAGFHPVAMGLSMIALGAALVGVAIALGG